MELKYKLLGKGTGMGLYIVKELVDKIGWEIKIKSDSGKGTTVKLIKRGYYKEKTY